MTTTEFPECLDDYIGDECPQCKDYFAEIAAINKMVDAFAAKMKSKLHAKAGKGWTGWDYPGHRQSFEDRLVDHSLLAIRGDAEQWVDVANFAAFLDSIATVEDNQT